MLSRFHPIPERNGRTDGQTDGQTDRFAISISRVSMLTRDKNGTRCIQWQTNYWKSYNYDLSNGAILNALNDYKPYYYKGMPLLILAGVTRKTIPKNCIPYRTNSIRPDD